MGDIRLTKFLDLREQSDSEPFHNRVEIFNQTTIRILSLIEAWQCQRGKPPIFSRIQKHQEGNLNASQLKVHLDSLTSLGYIDVLRALDLTSYKVTESGKAFIESLPEKLTHLQANKKHLSTF